MSRIIVPRRKIWTRQPQRPVGVDWSNPLMVGLVLASDPLSLLVLGTNGAPISKWSTNATETSSPVAMAVDQDLGLCINSTHDFADLTGTNATVSDDSSITFVSVFKTSTFDQVRSYLTRGADGAGSGWSFRISTNTAKKVEAGIVLTSGGTAGYTATSTTTVDGKVVVAAATYDKVDKYLRLYINGELEASVSTGKTGMRSSTLGIRIGGSFAAAEASFGGYSYGKVGPQLVWNRALSASEIARISANVRIGLKPRTRRTIIDLGASGGALNASASGSDTASGSATLAAQVALAGVGVSLAGGSAQAGVAVPLSASGISVAGGSANGTATVSISAAGLAQAAGQAGLSASVLLAAAGAAQASGNATLAAQLNALASGAAQASGSANLSGGAPGALSASGGDVASGSAVLSVSVQLQATGAGQAGGSANGTASAPGAISAAGQANAAGFATWSALVTLTAAGFVQAAGAGSFKVDIPLAAAGTAQASGVAQASLGGLVNRFALQAREKRLTEAAASVLRVALIETDVARLTRMVHEVKHV